MGKLLDLFTWYTFKLFAVLCVFFFFSNIIISHRANIFQLRNFVVVACRILLFYDSLFLAKHTDRLHDSFSFSYELRIEIIRISSILQKKKRKSMRISQVSIDRSGCLVSLSL